MSDREPRVAIVGSREWGNPQAVRDYVAHLPVGTRVISGGARGVDSWAVSEAEMRAELGQMPHPLVFAADWKRYGRSAGMRRNALIVDMADRVVAFWDGESRGTADTISKARAAGKPVEIIRPLAAVCPGGGR